MQYGIVIPFEPVHEMIALARAAEANGWDGFFLGDSIWSPDPWVMLGAIAARTECIRLGPLLTPVSRRRPWKLAAEVATLDQISNGRAILAVGLGALDTGFANVGEVTDRRARAAMLDEALAIITRLWQGEPVDFEGGYYRLDKLPFAHPVPVQQPRVPVWVVGAWPHEKSVGRALRWDGWITAKKDGAPGFSPVTPDDIRAMVAHARAKRSGDGPFDIVVEGESPLGDREEAAAYVHPFAEAGATWWIESLWDRANDLDYLCRRIEQGPPRVEEFFDV